MSLAGECYYYYSLPLLLRDRAGRGWEVGRSGPEHQNAATPNGRLAGEPGEERNQSDAARDMTTLTHKTSMQGKHGHAREHTHTTAHCKKRAKHTRQSTQDKHARQARKTSTQD